MSQQQYSVDAPQQYAVDVPQQDESLQDEEKRGKKHEHKGELGALGAGAFGMHEGHEKKKDPEHERRHKIEEEAAGAGAVGSAGYTAHEHHQVKKDEKDSEGKKQHHLF